MQLLALRHQAPARQGISVLAADQTADFAQPLGIDYAEARAVAGTPHELLVEGGHELAVVVEDLAGVGDEDRAVPETAGAVGAALVEAYVGVDVVLGAGLLEGAHFLAVD